MRKELNLQSKALSRETSPIIFLLFLAFLFSLSPVQAQDLVITKKGDVNANPGELISYTLHYSNTSLTSATDVLITDYLPDPTSYTYISSNPTGIYDAGNNRITWSKNEIPELSSLTSTYGEITVTLRAGTQAANTYFYIPSSPVTAENKAAIQSNEITTPVESQTVSTEIEQHCGLTFSPLDQGEVKSSGSSQTRYMVNVINQGNIYDKFIIDTLQVGHPNEETILDISLYDLNGNPLTETNWLAPGEAFYFFVDVLLDDPAPANTFNYLDIIGWSSICPSVSDTTTAITKIHNPSNVKSLLFLSKLDGTDPAQSGDTLNYTIYIYNYSDIATVGLTVTETYDPNVQFLSANPSPSVGDNIWHLPSLAGGDYTTIDVQVIVDLDLPNGTMLTNYVLADASNADAADVTTTTTLVESAPDLSIQKTASPSSVTPHDYVTYTIHYSNIGNLTAQNVVIIDDYDENFLNITNPNGGTDDGSTLTFHLPDLAPGASGTISYQAQLKTNSSFSDGITLVNNTANVSTSTAEENFNNNETNAIVTVTMLPDLAITIVGAIDPVTVNQTLTYTLTIENIGNFRAENVSISATIPAGITVNSISDGGSLNAGTISWPLIDTMHVTNSFTRTFSATPDCNAYPSTILSAEVSNDIPESNYTNNTDSYTTNVQSNLYFIDCPSDTIVPMDNDACGARMVFATPTAVDDCEGNLTVTRTDSSPLNSGDIFPEGNTTIQFAASNSQGQTIDCMFTITVGPDTIPPVIHNVPADEVLECSDCIQAFENNNFEEPAISGSWASVLASDISGWNTTASDGRIEIQKSGGVDGVSSYSGSQHAELNGNNVGDLYQEFCTVPTTTVQISFAHHKRMASLNTTDDIMEVFTGPNMSSLTSLGLFTATDNSGWTIHTIDFPIPAGQSSTVFVFRAVQGAPGNPTYGNLIDDINVITLFDASLVPYATDNCTVESLSLYEEKIDGSCLNDYRINRTWTAVDQAGNTTTATQSVIVGDVIGPDFTAPADVSISCEDNPDNLTLTGNITDIYDNCDPSPDSIRYEDSITPGSCPSNYTITRTWTLTDHCLNATSKTQVITVTDNTPPVFNEALPGDQALECSTNSPAVTLTANDNCGIATVSFSENPIAGSCEGYSTIERTWTAEDECSNTTTHTQILQFEDHTAPNWTTTAGSLNRSVECSSPDELNDAMALSPAASDECSSNITITEQPEVVGVCVGTYTITRSWIATDDCGNQSTAFTQIITVEDTTPPNITTAASNLSVECDGSGNTSGLNNWLNTNAGAVAVDNCADVSWSNDFTALSDLCAETGAVTVTFTAVDNCGNAASTSATFTIVDATPPSIDVQAADLTVECDGSGNTSDLNNWLNTHAGATASDICGTNISWSNNFTALSNDCGNTGQATVTFTATDECGNASSTSATFIIVDTTPPSIDTQASDLTIECDGSGNTSDLNNWLNNHAGAAASDICGTNISWSNDFTSLSDDCGNTGQATVTFTATDECGNTASTSATFTIIDTTSPIWTTPSGSLDRSVECSSPDELNDALALSPAASDECSSNITITEQPEVVGVCVGTYTITRSWVATDDCGNQSTTFTQIITVEDTTPPDINILASDLSVECDGSGNTSDLNNWLNTNGGAVAVDNCADVSWSNDFTALSDLCAETGAITVTFTAVDNCGNAASTSATFTIVDSTPPSIDVQAADLTVECDGSGNTTDLNNWLNNNGGATASDICGTNISWSNNFTALSNDCGNTGQATVTFTATDECGNAASTSATFIIVDTTPPNWTTPEGELNRTLDCTDTEGLNAAMILYPEASESCSSFIISNPEENIIHSDCPNSYTLERSWVATDDCGNASEKYVQIINVYDQEAPQTQNLPDVNLRCSDREGLQNALDLRPDFADNCSPKQMITIQLIKDTSVFSCENTYLRTRIWEGTDLCGNAAYSSQKIFVSDTTRPTADALPDLFFLCASEIPAPSVDIIENASDNCSSTLTKAFLSESSDGKRCPETLNRFYSVSDDCGNELILKQIITIHDTLPPHAESPEDMTFATLSEVPEASTSMLENVWDNCTLNPNTLILATPFDSLSSPPYFTYQFRVEDACGNYTDTAFKLFINDFPTAQNDVYTIDENSVNNKFYVLQNDIFGYDGAGNPCFWVEQSPETGSLQMHDNGTPNKHTDDFFVYTPKRNNYQSEQFEYCIADKSGDISRATVQIIITPNPLHIPEAFSPNGDGINEVFYIRGLYYYPNNGIIIYDENGNKVFENKPYLNDWDGTNHYTGNPYKTLPQATYFYILDLGDGRKPIKGYVYINRLN